MQRDVDRRARLATPTLKPETSMAAKRTTKSGKRSTSGSRSPEAGAARKSPAQSRDRNGAARKTAKGASASRGTPGGKSGRQPESRTRTGRSGAARKSSARAASDNRGAKASGTRGGMDALKLLKEDHERVDQLFKKYDRMKEGDERKQALLETILEELRVHAQVEEELFYPALNARFESAGKDKEQELIDEAEVEHETVKWLMEQLEGEQSDEHTRDARVKVMGEYVRHHVKEEEGQMFKAAKKVDVDLAELGRQMDARKRQLKGEEPADQEGMAEGEDAMRVSEPAAMATSGGRSH
jgi:hypothetical protein